VISLPIGSLLGAWSISMRSTGPPAPLRWAVCASISPSQRTDWRSARQRAVVNLPCTVLL
jgi:hypothetical protein